VDLVDVRLFRREVDVLADLVADIAEERVVDEVLDDGVLVAGNLSISPSSRSGVRILTAAILHSSPCSR
jgi:hypothetical protein